MFLVSNILNYYYKTRLSSPGYRKKAFILARQNKLRNSLFGKILLRNLNQFMAACPETHDELKALPEYKDYQSDFWASDLGYLWYESNFIATNVYFDFAEKEIKENLFSSLLDVGCGWGNFCNRCAEIESMKTIVGIDVSQEVIAIARSKIKSDKVSYASKTINEVSEQFDIITFFGSTDYITPVDFTQSLEKAIRLANKEVILVNSLRGIPFEEAMKNRESIEVKRYDTGYLHPMNYILSQLKEKYSFNFTVMKYGKDSQLALITK